MSTVNRASRQPHLKLKHLRKLCCITQKALAAKLGVSTASIIAIEVGYLPLSKKMAGRIGVALGVHPESLLSEGPLLTWDGLPFTAKVLRERDRAPTFRAGEVDLKPVHYVLAGTVLMAVHALLKAAVVANKLPVACFLIEEHVINLAEELGVERAFLDSDKQDFSFSNDIFPAVPLVAALRLKKRLSARAKKKPVNLRP